MNWYAAVQMILGTWHFVDAKEFADMQAAIRALITPMQSFGSLKPDAWAVHRVTFQMAQALIVRKSMGQTDVSRDVMGGIESAYKLPRREPTQFRNEHMGEFYNEKLGETYTPPRYKLPANRPRILDQP